MRILKWLLIIGIVALVLLCIYAFKIEPRLVTVSRLTLEHGNKKEHTMKVVQVSDTQLSKAYSAKRLAKIVQKVNAEESDILVFTGDLFDDYEKYGPVEEMIQALSAMTATTGKYAVWGNHDYTDGSEAIYEDTMTQGGFLVLKNEGETLNMADGGTVFIGGLDDSLHGQTAPKKLLSYRERYDYSIILTHEPDIADEFIHTETQLVLAGHSHGGQLNLPFIESPRPLYAQKYKKGLYQLSDDLSLYVNSGLGTTFIHARFRVPPEISSFIITF